MEVAQEVKRTIRSQERNEILHAMICQTMLVNLSKFSLLKG